MPDSTSDSMIASIWARWPGLASGGSKLASTSAASAARPSPGRSSTCSTMPWSTSKLDVSRSGVPPTSRSNVASFQSL